MWYGNVRIVLFYRGKLPQFKSYYVVWKLFIKYIITDKEKKFKSYYVVWKHK